MTKRHNIWSHFRLAALLAVLVLALCGCSSDDVRLPERVDLFRGQQFALASAVEIEGDPDAADVLAALAAADAHGVTVDFASADESVATVDELGIVQGVAPGETTVTVTCAAFGYTARVQVAVLEPAAALTAAPQLTLEPGQTASLDAAVENADPAGLVYTVSDETVAAVDEAGNVTALAQGRADITVSLPGSSLTAVCRLTVGTPVESIQLSRPEASLTAGQTLTLAAATAPAQDAAVTWQTSDPAVATVENGVVTAHDAGAAVITAAADGCTAECVLTVTAPAAATPESVATAETASAPATAETATPESATPESAAPATPESAATAETAGIPATPESAATAETAGSPATPETATGETALPATAESATAESALPRRQASSGTATPESAATAETAGSPATPETATGETALPATAESATGETALPRRQTSSGTATPESAATPETALPATAESATGETAAPATAESATTESAGTPENGASGGDGASPAPQEEPAQDSGGFLGWLSGLWDRLFGG